MEITITIKIKDEHLVGLDKTMTLPCLEFNPETGECREIQRDDLGPKPLPSYGEMVQEIAACIPGAPLDFDPDEWPWGC